MPTSILNFVEPAGSNVQIRLEVESLLKQRNLMNMKELAGLANASVAELTRLLPDWLDDNDCFECLMPLFASSGNPELVFFRRKECTDTDYLWEKDVSEPTLPMRHPRS